MSPSRLSGSMEIVLVLASAIFIGTMVVAGCCYFIKSRAVLTATFVTLGVIILALVAIEVALIRCHWPNCI